MVHNQKATNDGRLSGLGPEIAMFREGEDSFRHEKDWYIKSAP